MDKKDLSLAWRGSFNQKIWKMESLFHNAKNY